MLERAPKLWDVIRDNGWAYLFFYFFISLARHVPIKLLDVLLESLQGPAILHEIHQLKNAFATTDILFNGLYLINTSLFLTLNNEIHLIVSLSPCLPPRWRDYLISIKTGKAYFKYGRVACLVLAFFEETLEVCKLLEALGLEDRALRDLR